MKTFYLKIFSTFCLLFFVKSIIAQPGTLDSGFGVNGQVYLNNGLDPRTITIQDDGKLLLGCVAVNPMSMWRTFSIARLLSNGQIDSSFGVSGKMVYSFTNIYDGYPLDIKVQNDGKILLGGAGYILSGYSDFELIRCKENGVLDSSFGINGLAVTDLGSSTDEIYSLDIQSDGKILAAGSTNGTIGIARYDANGKIDSAFGQNGIITHGIACFSIKSLPDGKFITAGFGDEAGFGIRKYLNNGTPDSTFGVNGQSIIFFSNENCYAKDLVVLQNGELLVTGSAVPDQIRPQIALAKLKSNGSLDSSFGINGKLLPAFGYNYIANSILMQNDGKVILAALPSSGGNYIVGRLFPNGSVDSSFGVNGVSAFSFGGYDDYRTLNFCSLQKDGKLVLTGTETYYIARIKGDEPITVNFQKNVSTAEGNSGTKQVAFKAVLNRPSQIDVQVNYNTIDGTAKSGSDYIAASSTALIKAGKVVANIPVSIIGDSIRERNEKFFLALSNPVNANVGVNDTANCTIKNDDFMFAPSPQSSDDAAVKTSLVKVYPNPANDYLQIQELELNTNISLHDMRGNVVKQAIASGNYKMNVSGLAAGVYELVITTKTRVEKIKVVKE